jgi:sugar/nucleoside kinase (ribokinase family)
LSLLIVGSVAYDDIDTPHGNAKDVLGGSATYAGIAASQFTDVKIVAVIGSDFKDSDIQLLKDSGIDTAGLSQEDGETFHWHGRYSQDMNDRETLSTKLGVFEGFDPKIPTDYAGTEFVFLGNIHPALQSTVLDQIDKPKFVALDTMNFWIEGTPDDLKKVLGRIDALVINDSETRLLAGKDNLVAAARDIRAMGPETLIIKRGEYGALLFYKDEIFSAPGMPLENVFDPTGAGDSFAGGFMGHLAKTGEINSKTMRQAIIVGSTLASYCVEDFGVGRLRAIDKQDIAERFGRFVKLASFEPI